MGSRKGSYKSGFATVPQGSIELQSSIRNEFVPQPQAMFIYQERGAGHSGPDEQKLNGYNGTFPGTNGHITGHTGDEEVLTVDHSPGAVNGGYDMEEIIPSVIYSTNHTVSESYGLIKHEDEDTIGR